MNNTKTIFKSLLIMIVAISLFTVSCSKDEGGTKTPTTPTIQKISPTDVETILKGLGKLPTGTPVVDFGETVFTASTKGEATLTAKKNTLTDVKNTLEPVLKKANFNNEKIELTADATFGSDPSGRNPLEITLVFKAKAGYEFDITIAGKYNYNETDKTATLKLKISPPSSQNWA